MKILIVSATHFEIAPFRRWIEASPELQASIEFLVAGIGVLSTAYALGKRFAEGPQVDMAIQAGIGGALDLNLPLTEVYQIITDRSGDLGAEDSEGGLLSLQDIGLAPQPPFNAEGILKVDPLASGPPNAHGITVSRAHGFAPHIELFRAKYPEAQIESMEGAAFFYACLSAGVKPLQLRALSNYVETRDRAKWRVREAVGKLNSSLREVVSLESGVWSVESRLKT